MLPAPSSGVTQLSHLDPRLASFAAASKKILFHLKSPTMPIELDDSNALLRTIRISGRLDLLGTDEISTKFAAWASTSERRVIVDLTAVSFLASIGIRAIITNAKALKQRGGRMVLFVGDNQGVAKTLTTTGIGAIVPMFDDKSAAEQAATA